MTVTRLGGPGCVEQAQQSCPVLLPAQGVPWAHSQRVLRCGAAGLGGTEMCRGTRTAGAQVYQEWCHRDIYGL